MEVEIVTFIIKEAEVFLSVVSFISSSAGYIDWQYVNDVSICEVELRC